MLNGTVKITAGKWRGRRVFFHHRAHVIRPSPDRVRETLFNWLQAIIPGASCLDLFAGSGILGLEALSRAAKSVVWVDQQRSILHAIQQHLDRLSVTPAQQATTLCRADARRFIPDLPAAPFDVVFLDPPFRTDLLVHSLNWLTQSHYLHHMTHIYIEAEPAHMMFQQPPTPWCWHRLKISKHLGYGLLKKNTY